jgi:2-phosphosulfolactate phosphatase
MERTVAIDLGPRCKRSFDAGDAVVVVDVIRSMTVAVTAAALGARCVPVPSLDRARALARVARRPLLVGELDGARPPGFDLTNSPAELMRWPDLSQRTVVLLSSSGTPLIDEVRRAGAIYPGCLRNWRALSRHLAREHERVILVGAATRGSFREEDQICCAYLAAELENSGFAIADEKSAAIVDRWSSAPAGALLVSRSIDYLQRTGAVEDVYFILEHVDDLDEVFRVHRGEIVSLDQPFAAAI